MEKSRGGIAQSLEHSAHGARGLPFESHKCLHSYVEEISSAAMLATKRSAGVTSEVNLREHITHTPPQSLNMAVHSGFETQRRHHQKSKTWVSVARQKGLMSFKIKKKNYVDEETKQEHLSSKHFSDFTTSYNGAALPH